MEPAGRYMRSLPSPPAIDFSSAEGKQLFLEAFQNGNLVGFFKLIPHFQTQSDPAYCGLASLAMVLNGLSIDPYRKWKGFWRWFDERMLNFIEPLFKVKKEGISFGKVVCLAQCVGASVQAYLTNQTTIDDFRKFVVACSSSEVVHVISSYHRKGLRQIGTGHFSPIGGYHAERDMVLLLDVARFKYPPHWVPISDLWAAMDMVDEATGLHRGFMLVSKKQRPPPSLPTQSWIDDSWVEIAKYLTHGAPLLSSNTMKDVKDVISTIISSLPSNFIEFIRNVAEFHQKEYEAENNNPIYLEVQKLVQETSLYKHVTDTLSSGDSGESSSVQPASKEDLTELLLALPPKIWSVVKEEKVLRDFSSLVSIESLPLLLQHEVLHLRGQLLVLKRCHENRKKGVCQKKRKRSVV